MAVKDITDRQVCLAYKSELGMPDTLMRMTGQSEKVCYCAMERARRHGLVDYSVSLRSGWLTESGEALICPSV